MNPYTTAMRQPLALLVLLATIATGLTVSVWLLPVGLVVYIAAVMLAARDPQLVQGAQRTVQRQHLTSPTFRALSDEIVRSQEAVQESIDQASGPLQAVLQNVRTQSAALVEQSQGLALKGQVIEQYLASTNPTQIQGQINELDERMARTSDSYTLQQLTQTRQALVDRQSNAQVLETYIGRITAQIQNIDANLDNVLAETVRLRTADAASANSASSDVAQRLSDLNADMDAFQRVLEQDIQQALKEG